MTNRHVFSDPSGNRWKALKGVGAVLGVATAVVTTFFAVSMLIVPLLPQIPGLSGPAARLSHTAIPVPPPRQTALSRFLLRRTRLELWREMANARKLKETRRAELGPPGGRQVVAAFYAPWQETGLHSLRAHAEFMTHVMPDWLHVDKAGTGLDTSDWDPEVTPHNLDVVQIARDNRAEIHPMLNNAKEGAFDGARAHRLLASPQAQQELAVAAAAFLRANGFQGINLDFENLSDEDYRRLPAFAKRLADVLHAGGFTLSADVEVQRGSRFLKAMAAQCDFLIVMAYDEHYESGTPGPIASAGWYYKVLEETLRSVPPEKLVVGIGNYAYDWNRKKGTAESISYQTALIEAEDNRPDEAPQKIIDFDADALNPTFTYADDDGDDHEVWMLDGVTAYNEWLMASRLRLRGAALWALGFEDPSVWSFLRRRKLDDLPPAQALEEVTFPYEIEFDGDGEILSVVSTPEEGRRKIEVDLDTGLITDMEYSKFPSSFVIRRAGYHPGEIALTFDDGPDPRNTPKILDLLHREGVPATFFVIGESAERYPDLVRRYWHDGDEIGSHTFSHPNMAAVSHRRAVLELNATQRAVQSIIGRSTILFRPPYNADAEPVSAEEVKPIQIASELGYITVGELIDPQDWNLYGPAPGGGQRQRTPQDIVDAVLKQLKTTKGNVILLHDGGGDRSHTLEALKVLIPELKRRGCRFVAVSDLLGMPRDRVMPPMGEKDHMLIGVDRLIFQTVYVFETSLQLAFNTAIALGIGRVLLLIPLALMAWLLGRSRRWDPDFAPPLSVLIAAYNESPVIGRTIQSVLASAYPVHEVIVVDDGSTDGTAETVEERFSGEPRVTIIRQANAGKASALNRAASLAEGDILLCLDADTQVDPLAAGLLVRHFVDPKVAAVAGNVKVGNLVNVLTQWQSIEYITSQNVDRRAYALMNAVSVVPGAAGAWRKKALMDVGGYPSDSMAEDMDLTWRLRRQGWRVTTEQEAIAMTEAPQSFRAFFKQRFRWTYGTLQCLWKHKTALFRYGWFGTFTLPTLWLFQVFFQILAPLVDLQVLYTTMVFLKMWMTRGVLNHDWQPLPQATHILLATLFFYGLFFAVDLAGGLIAFRLDREKPRRLWWLFWQRFVYRQIMYAVLWRSLVYALKGASAGWGKIERKGTVLPSE
jgi:poly-beta-1,6 N-acetyl-D-glucosamine synthase